METNYKLSATKAEVSYITSVCINTFLNHAVDNKGKLILKNIGEFKEIVIKAIQKDGFSIEGINN